MNRRKRSQGSNARIAINPRRFFSLVAALILTSSFLVGVDKCKSPRIFAQAFKLNARSNGKIVEETSVEEAVELIQSKGELKKTALMGKLFPIVSNLFVSKSNLSLRQILFAIADLIDEVEVALFVAIGWGLVPLSRSIYDVYANVTARDLEPDEAYQAYLEEMDLTEEPQQSKSITRKAFEAITPWDDDEVWRKKKVQEWVEQQQSGQEGGGEGAPPAFLTRRKKSFKDTLIYQVVDHVSQAAKVGVAVIGADCLALIGKLMGNDHDLMDNFSRIFSKVAYTGWITHRLQAFKRYLLRNTLGKSKIELGKLNIIDHLLDGMIYSLWLIFLLDFLEVQTGMAVKSLFSVGATGTLVLGLASKDIASQIMNGLTLHLSEKMYEGDEVRFSDGTSGVIVKMGWMETMIRSSDELVVGIPNTHLSGQRVYNLSRTPRSQVKQSLRISYNDADKIPKLLEAIKEEIKEACPKLITDGSRAFRAYWQNYEDDHLAVVVDCHFTIKPTGDEYWRNRQKMLEAIYRAVRETGVHFEKAVKS
mmetsp:Transcript_15564/g.33090  ORF Transcript_15564/g.33090 Transcript_15564/m.33090 type:complete len:534 (-) Transcript_15564:369-1970(-)